MGLWRTSCARRVKQSGFSGTGRQSGLSDGLAREMGMPGTKCVVWEWQMMVAKNSVASVGEDGGAGSPDAGRDRSEAQCGQMPGPARGESFTPPRAPYETMAAATGSPAAAAPAQGSLITLLPQTARTVNHAVAFHFCHRSPRETPGAGPGYRAGSRGRRRGRPGGVPAREPKPHPTYSDWCVTTGDRPWRSTGPFATRAAPGASSTWKPSSGR